MSWPLFPQRSNCSFPDESFTNFSARFFALECALFDTELSLHSQQHVLEDLLEALNNISETLQNLEINLATCNPATNEAESEGPDRKSSFDKNSLEYPKKSTQKSEGLTSPRYPESCNAHQVLQSVVM